MRAHAGRFGAPIALLLLGGITSCSHHTAPSTGPGPSRETDIPLEITNHNWLDVIVSVVHDGQSTRVGTAQGSSSSSFELPARLIGQGREIRLIGHPIGGSGSVITETIVVQPGQYIEWTLETDLKRSSVGVY